MKLNFLKIIRVLLLVFIFGNGIFYLGLDKTIAEYNERSWIESLVYLMGITTNSAIDQFIICGFAFYIIELLNNKGILKFDSNINFFLGYLLSVIVNFGFRAFYLNKINNDIMTFENIFITAFVPIIYSFLMYRIVKRFVKNKRLF